MTRYTRRKFLGMAASAALAACSPRTQASPTRTPNPEPMSPLATASAPTTPQPALTVYPAPPPPPTQTVITPVDSFYTQSYSSLIPQVESSAWTLTLDGLVNQALTLSLADLKARPAVEVMRTLECISNPVGGPQIGNAVWKGTYLKPLLDEAGLHPEVIRLKFEAADKYSTSVDLKYIYNDQALLAYEMNGEPLTAKHGFPLRVFFAGSYGQKMPKWITRIEAIDHDFEGYWEKKGWSDNAQVKTNAIIKEPHTSTTLKLDSIPIWGVAYAGKREIVKVEVKIGDEDWRVTSLLPGPSSEVWTQWSLTDWVPSQAQTYKIQVRATDSDGYTQNRTAGVLDGFPAGSDAIHAIYVKILKD